MRQLWGSWAALAAFGLFLPAMLLAAEPFQRLPLTQAPLASQQAGCAADTKAERDACTTTKSGIQLTLPPGSFAPIYVDMPSNVSAVEVTLQSAAPDVDLLVRQGSPHTATSLTGLMEQSAYVVATPGGNEQIGFDRDSPVPLTPGRWWMTAVNTGASSASVSINIQFTTSGAAFPLDPGGSGSWFEPARTYQGFFFEVLDPTTALAVWFTYEPDGRQAFLIGTGRIEGDRVTITELIKTRGGVFGAGFDPDQVVREDWGDLVFIFDSCGSGYGAYLPSELAASNGWQADQLNLQRLTAIDALPCPAPASKTLAGGISGAWYPASRSGEGWFVQALSADLAFVYWFSYTPEGEQAWFGSTGPIIDNTILIDQALQPRGGLFGPDYSPDTVSLDPWGAFALSFTDCGSAVARAVGPAGYGDFAYTDLIRLTALAGTDGCGFASNAFAATGSVIAPPGSYVDGDLNNPDVPNVDNDIPNQAQQVGNPALISGYATATPTGRGGDRFESVSDPIDAYQMTITAGQVLQLQIADWNPDAPTSIDLDLLVFAADDPSAPLFSSLGTGRNEFITLPTTGTYNVVVLAEAGGSNYTLSVSSAAPLGSANLALESEVVADEIIVRFDDGAGGKAPVRSAKAWAGLLGLDAKQGVPNEPMLFALSADARQRGKALTTLGVSKARREAANLGEFGLSDAQRQRWQWIQAIKALRSRADVRYVEPNGVAHPTAIPNDPGYPLQWHYPQINLPQAWDITTGSAEVIVAVIDTGVSAHADMAGQIRTDLGADLISSPLNACDGDGPDFDATDPGDGRGCGEQNSSSFHGTHVAGTVAAATNNGIGVAGIAWGSKIMPVRVLGRQGGSVFDVANGIRWAGGGGALGVTPARGADVLNLSLGGQSQCPSAYAEAIADARSRGAVIVAAAGNSNASLPFSPASCDGVINVAALNRGNRPAAYSNCHPTVAVAAPGGETNPEVAGSSLFPPQNGNACKPFSGAFARPEDGVLSPLGPGLVEPESYAYYQGTSMAAPHVAGVIALMKSVHPGLTPDQFDSLLASGRITRNVLGNPDGSRDPLTGFGLIDAFRAVNEALALAGGSAAPPVVLLQPGNLVFGETSTQLAFTIEAGGSGPLVVNSVTATVPWLSVSGGDSSGLGNYLAAVNRSGLPAGDYNGAILVQSNLAASQSISVNLRVGAPPAGDSGAVGQIYVVLVDPITGLPVRFTEAMSQLGEQPYIFENLRSGRYAIVAGTDNDNDGTICDPGEACGVFPDFDSFDDINLQPGDNLPAFMVPPDGNGIGAASAAFDGAAPARRSYPRPR